MCAGLEKKLTHSNRMAVILHPAPDDLQYGDHWLSDSLPPGSSYIPQTELTPTGEQFLGRTNLQPCSKSSHFRCHAPLVNEVEMKAASAVIGWWKRQPHWISRVRSCSSAEVIVIETQMMWIRICHIMSDQTWANNGLSALCCTFSVIIWTYIKNYTIVNCKIPVFHSFQ